MSEKRCFYEVLGLAKEASNDDIRKAYRRAALDSHPDRNPGNAEAERRFKEVSEAYQVLSDDDKRARYDRFGHAGIDGSGMPDFGGADIFSHFQDVFSEFFGMGGAPGGGRQKRRGPARGQDLRVQQRLTLKEAFLGVKREVSLQTPATCETCDGEGAKPGTKRKQCSVCSGSGQVSSHRGFVMFTQTCPECSGQGSVVKTPCDTCRGAGSVQKHRKVVVSFPAGIDGGQRLRVPGQGLPGSQGGPAGDLYVDVELVPDERFQREGADLLTRAKITFADAALGVQTSVALPDDTQVSVDVPPGTQPGDVLTIKGKGVPRVDGRGRGTLHIEVQVEVPTALTARARELLRQLKDELGEPVVEKAAANA
ncbi:MAG: molecular chaperone DnaJ [Polyangiaceae bacterium]|nr:molecular chaperone DnaJ [Polyangiaceae bacterium]